MKVPELADIDAANAQVELQIAAEGEGRVKSLAA